MKNIEQRLTALETAPGAQSPPIVIRVGNEPMCDGPDELTARRNAGIPDDHTGQVIIVNYTLEPT